MRVPAAAVAVLVASGVAGCGGSSGPSAAPAPSTSAAAPAAGRTPHPVFTIPPQVLPFDPCKLSAAQVSRIVGFTVVKQAKRSPDQCEYDADPAGVVSMRVDSNPTINVTQDKSNETFSLGGRYITVADETGFPKGGFTAVKNPGYQSPGVIADAVIYLDPGHLVLRIYYPSGGHQPGRAHALALAHALIG